MTARWTRSFGLQPQVPEKYRNTRKSNAAKAVSSSSSSVSSRWREKVPKNSASLMLPRRCQYVGVFDPPSCALFDLTRDVHAIAEIVGNRAPVPALVLPKPELDRTSASLDSSTSGRVATAEPLWLAGACLDHRGRRRDSGGTSDGNAQAIAMNELMGPDDAARARRCWMFFPAPRVADVLREPAAQPGRRKGRHAGRLLGPARDEPDRRCTTPSSSTGT